MRSVPRPRTLRRRRHSALSTDGGERRGIVGPIRVVEVDCQEPAGLVLQEREYADRLSAAQVAVHSFIGQRDQVARPAVNLLALVWLGRRQRLPVMPSLRRVTGLVPAIGPANSLDILSATKQAPE